MGFDYRTYIGPHVVCKVEVIDKGRTVRTCPNTACKGYQRTPALDAPFCPHCGTPLSKVTTPELHPQIDSYEVQEQLSERLTTPGGDVYYMSVRETGRELWIPNVGIPDMDRDPHLDASDFTHTIISVNMIDREMVSFRLAFGPDIAFLKQIYGADNVTVEWGIIQDYI